MESKPDIAPERACRLPLTSPSVSILLQYSIIMSEVSAPPNDVAQWLCSSSCFRIRKFVNRQAKAIHQKGVQELAPSVQPQLLANHFHFLCVHLTMQPMASTCHVTKLAQPYTTSEGMFQDVQVKKQQIHEWRRHRYVRLGFRRQRDELIPVPFSRRFTKL